jgi:hypothetical protein
MMSTAMLILPIFALSLAVQISTAAEDVARVARELPTSKGRESDAWNRPPLAPSSLARLPVGSIAPHGWLREQLELQAQGMHGRLQEISGWLNWKDNGWVDPKGKKGWEEAAYWLKGYADLGYVLGDEKINAESKRWIKAMMATQQPDGFFGPATLRTSMKGLPDLWPHMLMLSAVRSYYEYSGDPRALQFMVRFTRYESLQDSKVFGLWLTVVRSGDNLDVIYWLYNKTGEAWLLDVAKKIHDGMADLSRGLHDLHGVNVSESFREPAQYWMQAKERRLLDAAERNYQQVMREYGQFPGGGFAADEGCRRGYTDPRQGFETCSIVEFINSFLMLNRITGNPLWADRCEDIAFNSLPAALTPDLKAVHYLTCANQVQLDRGDKSPGIQNKGKQFSYCPSWYRCCQHNHGMGWPYYAEELWLATADGGLCASLYAASEATAKVADDAMVRIVEETDYPFEETVSLRVHVLKSAKSGEVRFPLYLRIPRWCSQAAVKVNDKKVDLKTEPLSYAVINRTWRNGDRLTLQLPMSLSVQTWTKNKNSVSVNYGPLTFSLKIGERWVRGGNLPGWPDWEVFATTPWNYGLAIDAANPAQSFQIVRKSGPLAPQPFTPETSPIELRAKARKIPSWTLDAKGLLNVLPQSPVKSDESEETIALVPMGAARLRISAFPTLRAAP